MHTHVKVLGILHIVFGAIGVLIAGLVSLADSSGDGMIAIPILGIVGALVMGVMLVLSAIHLLNIPFGTALGAYGLWALLSPEVTAAFQSPTHYV
ncbi:MAG: hypothetical protein SGI92_11345 [Bryobacteraceae bacterium]|nr:hypothetical protein [Bryobacteraceae bacterium]